MKPSIRLHAVACAAAAGLALTVPLATPGSAAPKPSVVCSKLLNGVLSGCTPAALKAGATSKYVEPPPGTAAGTLKVVYTWKGGKGKTTALVKFKQMPTSPGKCKVGTTRIKATGKVTGGSGKAATIIKKNEPFTASVCAYVAGPNAGKTSLEPGTKLKL